MDLKVYSAQDFPDYLPKLNELYDDIFSGGKGFRAQLTQTVAASLNLPDKTTHLLCQTVEFIHNSSLLHDDLVDRSSLRRGKTTAWLKYTPEYAVLAGDYLLARVMVNLSTFGNIELVKITSQAISDLLEGEWLQDSLVKNINCQPKDIDRVHNLKTGSLFKWCLTSPFVAQNINNEIVYKLLNRIGDILGLLLQRSDDLLDFDVRNYERKNIMGDLKAGYVNSFCASLFLEMPLDKKTEASKIFDLKQFKEFVGFEFFNTKLKAFDTENTALIEEYKVALKELSALANGEYKDTATSLEPLADLLYWRKP
ncbi:MAG: polyprenyl synthetase family protein [Bdellovibrionaceae bacterium]|nr:polyprenyl synthetase family protein [Pseudobdellovibrionaceae bacterium]